MSRSTITRLKNTFGESLSSSCEKRSCRLDLSRLPDGKVILDIDRIAAKEPDQIPGRRCDYIIAVCEGGTAFLIPVEFKAKTIKPSEVKEQLEGGVSFFIKHHDGPFICRPVLVSKSLKRMVGKQLQNTTIAYRGQTARIKHVRCNQSLQWSQVSTPG